MSHEVWDMQKERRAKNCFEDLTTQLQEEVKLVTRLTLFPRPCDPRSSRYLAFAPSISKHGYAWISWGFQGTLFSLPSCTSWKTFGTIWPYVAYHCADQSGVYLNSTIAHQGLVMQVPFLQTLDARALRFLIGRLSDPRQARLSQADKFFLQRELTNTLKLRTKCFYRQISLFVVVISATKCIFCEKVLQESSLATWQPTRWVEMSGQAKDDFMIYLYIYMRLFLGQYYIVILYMYCARVCKCVLCSWEASWIIALEFMNPQQVREHLIGKTMRSNALRKAYFCWHK